MKELVGVGVPSMKQTCLLAVLAFHASTVCALKAENGPPAKRQQLKLPSIKQSEVATLPRKFLLDSNAAKTTFLARLTNFLNSDATLSPTSFDAFLPKCLEHLASLIKTFDHSYTDSHLRTNLLHECAGAHAGFDSEEFCKKFTEDLVSAREEELATGSTKLYPPLCKAYYAHKYGSQPTVPPQPATPAAPTPALPAAPPPPTSPRTATKTATAPPRSPPPPPLAPTTTAAPVQMVDVGSSKCPCIGLSGVEGEVEVSIDGGMVPYPADLGGRCNTWDKTAHPLCKKGSEAWCKQKWCYVDPCNCDLPVLPKTSSYMPGVKFQGKSIYYSYATCGEKDKFTAENYAGACVNQDSQAACSKQDKCAWDGKKCLGKELQAKCEKLQDPWVAGFWGCRCIGLAGVSGKLTASGSLSFPASMGSVCHSWDEDTHPDCKGSGAKPDWCKDKWCYIDPCSCNLPEKSPPKKSSYLPGATFQNKPLYYSYGTCDPGATDSFTANKNPNACVNRKTQTTCEISTDCAWAENRCLGKEIAGMCDP